MSVDIIAVNVNRKAVSAIKASKKAAKAVKIVKVVTLTGVYWLIVTFTAPVPTLQTFTDFSTDFYNFSSDF
jgi:hypothetical protein